MSHFECRGAVVLLLLFITGASAQHALTLGSYDYALSFYSNGPATFTGGTVLSAQTSVENCFNAILAKSPAVPYITSYSDYMFALLANTSCVYPGNGDPQYNTFLAGLATATEWNPVAPTTGSTSVWYHATNVTAYAIAQATAPLPILNTPVFYGYQCIKCTALNTSGLQDLFYETTTILAASYLEQILLGKLTIPTGVFAYGAITNTLTGYSPTSGAQTAVLFPPGACPVTAISVVPCSGAGGSNPNLSQFAASSPYGAQAVALYQPACNQAYNIWNPNTTVACVYDPCNFILQNTNVSVCANGGSCTNNYPANTAPLTTCFCTGNFNPATNCTTCTTGWTTAACNVWNPCSLSNPCAASGTCINNATQGGFPQSSCLCANGYGGVTCSIWEPCVVNNTCVNGATCVANATAGANPIESCTCAPGYVGNNCQTWAPCSYNQTACNNGATCVGNATAGATPILSCACAPGYVGATCQTWAPCSYNQTACNNGGTCVANATVGATPILSCTCQPGYVGSACQTWAPCSYNQTACNNGGTCVANATVGATPILSCACQPGYVGSACQTWAPCSYNLTACNNGGTCVANATVGATPILSCACTPGYVGSACQTWAPCSYNQTACNNGGTCVANATIGQLPILSCTCRPGYIGASCQTWDPCTYYNQPCQNYGLCTDNSTANGSPSFTCACSIGYTGQNCSVWDPCNAIPNACPKTAIGCSDMTGPSLSSANYTCLYSSTVLAGQGYRYAITSDVNGPSNSKGAVFLGNAATIIQCANMVLSTPGIPFLNNFIDAYFYFNLYANPAQCYYLNSSTVLATFEATVSLPAAWQQLLNLQSENWFHVSNLTAYSAISATLPYSGGQTSFSTFECLTCPSVGTALQALYLASGLNGASYLTQTLAGFPDLAYGFYSSGSIPNFFYEFLPNSPNQTIIMHPTSNCAGGLMVVPCASLLTSPVQSSFDIPVYNALLYRPTCPAPLQIWDPTENGGSNTYTYCEFEPCKYYVQHNTTSCANGGTCINNAYATTTYGGGVLPGFNCSCPPAYTNSSNCTACSSGYIGSNCQWNPCLAFSPCFDGGTCVNGAVGSSPGYTCVCTQGYTGVNCSTWNPCVSFPDPCPHGGVCSNQPGPDPTLNYTCAYDPNNLVVTSFPYGVSIDLFPLENYITSGFTYLGPTTSAAECINIVLARAAQLPFVTGYRDIFVHFQQYSNPTDCSYVSSVSLYNELVSTVSSQGAWTSIFGNGAETIWYYIANITAYAPSMSFLPNVECLYCPGNLQLNTEAVYFADTLSAANSYIQLLYMNPRIPYSFFSLSQVPLKFGLPPSPNVTLGAYTLADCPSGLQITSCSNPQQTFLAATLTSFAFNLTLYRPACNATALQVWEPESAGGNGNACVYDPCTWYAQRLITTCLDGGTCANVPLSQNSKGFVCACPTGYSSATNCSTCSPGFENSNCAWEPCVYYAGVCQNGGTCVANATVGGSPSFNCACLPGFVNSTCQTWDPCTYYNQPCQNGAVCKDNSTVGGIPSFQCTCAPGFTGQNCTTWNPCGLNPCLNGANCTANATVGGSPPQTCGCPLGFGGSNCSIWEPCINSACEFGSVCIANSTIGGSPQYSCSCSYGFINPMCSIWSPCQYLTSPCNAHGVCANNATVGSFPGFACNCSTGFTGMNCSTCAAGYLGPTCQWDPCDYLGGSTALCGTNGVCLGSLAPPLNYTCNCTAGFTGSACQAWDPCSYYNQPCQNGGTCFNGNTPGLQPGYVCECAPGYTGQNCQSLITTTTSTTSTTASTTSTSTATTVPTTSTTTAPTTSTTTAPPTTTTTTAPPTNSSSSALSTGAVVGIAVGAVAGTVVLVAVAVAVVSYAGGASAGAASGSVLFAGEGSVLLHSDPRPSARARPNRKQKQTRTRK